MNNKTVNVGAAKFRSVKPGLATFCLGLFSMLTLAGNAQADTAPVHCRYTNFATLPITFSGLLPTVQGSVNNSPVTMLLETGAQRTELTQQEAEKFQLKLGHKEQYRVDANTVASSYETLVDDISLGELHWHSAKVRAMSDSDPSLSYGARVGADMLFNKDIEISLATHELKFFEPTGCDDAFLAYWDDNASTVLVEEMSQWDHRQVVTVEINGKTMRALIDSGTPTSVIDLAAAAKAGVTPQSPGVTEIGNGTSQAMQWLALFENFSIGGETTKNSKIRIENMYEQKLLGSARAATEEWKLDRPDMLLGADFMRSHRLLFSVRQHRMYFSYLGGKVFGNEEASKLAMDIKPK
jgi:predicted aspartyl protease